MSVQWYPSADSSAGHEVTDAVWGYPLSHNLGQRPTATAALPPGPTTAPLFQVLRWLRQPLPFLDECATRYGDAFTIRLAAAPPLILFTHPRDVREILTHDPDRLQAGAANAALAPVLGPRSLLLLDGARHREMRRLMMPPFHGERLAGYGTTMHAVTDEHIASWPVERPFSLHVAMQEIALDVVIRTVFGDDGEAASAGLRALVLDLLGLLAQPFVRVPWGAEHRQQPKRWRRIAEARAQLDAALRTRIASRRAAGPHRGGDVLSLLVAARDEAGQPLSEPELCDQLVTLLVAGHETTATALAWAFHHLLARPSLVARLQAELAPLGPDRLGATPRLEATIDETLRLQPVFAVVGRRLAQPTTVGGFDLPAGSVAAACIYLVHRRPDVWRAPGEFDPDRFLGTHHPTPYEFLPFGGGARRCLGTAFALYEMRIVLARVLARTRLRAVAGSPAESVRRSITLAPAGGVPAVLEARIR